MQGNTVKNWYRFHTDIQNPFSSMVTIAAQKEAPLDTIEQQFNMNLNAAERWPEAAPKLIKTPFHLFLFNCSDIEETVIIDINEKKIFIREFLFHTLLGNIHGDFMLYCYAVYLQLHNICSDLDIDLYHYSQDFIQHRRMNFSPEEFDALNYQIKGTESIHLRGMIFTAFINYNSMQKITHLEKKIIRDVVGTHHAKRILGLDENAYNYIEKKSFYQSNKDEERLIFTKLSQELSKKKIDFENYIDSHIVNKSLMVWVWWTISPFVSADISILLPMIHERKRITKIYIDLAVESQQLFSQYSAGAEIADDIIENEIKKIYPPILKDYQKETLPYLVLLNKIRQLAIPVECYGFTGLNLMEYEPAINTKNQIIYPPDKHWKKLLISEYQKSSTQDGDSLVLFFQFMKPMFCVPGNMTNERFERIIHVDRFTGYGPEKPENSIAVYSHYLTNTLKSFVYPNLNKASFSAEKIVHFPFSEKKNEPNLDDGGFNRFEVYDTMIYSSHQGGGGRKKHDTLSPADFSFQPQ